ncbi:hypothetical protein D3C72_1957070 [compost metagenome]
MKTQNSAIPTATTPRSTRAALVPTAVCKLSMATCPPVRMTKPAPKKVTQIIMWRATSSAQMMESPVV